MSRRARELWAGRGCLVGVVEAAGTGMGMAGRMAGKRRSSLGSNR